MDLQSTWHTLFVQNSGRNSRDGGERQPPEGGWVKILYLMLLPLLFFFYLLHLDLFFFFQHHTARLSTKPSCTRSTNDPVSSHTALALRSSIRYI